MSAAGLIVSGARERSRATLQARIRRAASGFAALGIGPGDCVALLLRNDFPFLEASTRGRPAGRLCDAGELALEARRGRLSVRELRAKAMVIHADLIAAAGGAPPGVPVLLVPTPPELAEAYGDHARRGAGRRGVGRLPRPAPEGTACRSRRGTADLHLRHHRPAEGRAPPPPTPEQAAGSRALMRGFGFFGLGARHDASRW